MASMPARRIQCQLLLENSRIIALVLSDERMVVVAKFPDVVPISGVGLENRCKPDGDGSRIPDFGLRDVSRTLLDSSAAVRPKK